MWIGAGVLGVTCLVLGIAPSLALHGVTEASRSVLPHPANSLDANWQIAADTTRYLLHPGLLGLLVAAAFLLVVAVRRMLQRSPVRHTPAWVCGRELQTPKMQYTASSFGEPLTRVFEDVLRPSSDLDLSHSAESRYYVESAQYHRSFDDAFERRIYRPAQRLFLRWGLLVRMISNGSVHRYLGFAMTALIVVLVVAS